MEFVNRKLDYVPAQPIGRYITLGRLQPKSNFSSIKWK